MSPRSKKKGPRVGRHSHAEAETDALTDRADSQPLAGESEPGKLTEVESEHDTEVLTGHLLTMDFERLPVVYGRSLLSGASSEEGTDIFSIARSIFVQHDAHQAHFVLLVCDIHGRPFGFKLMVSGTHADMFIKPAVLFRSALLLGAETIVVMYNRVSGDATPSDEDRAYTRLVAFTGNTINVQLLDHLIVALPDQFRSMRIEAPQLWHDE